MDLVVLLLLGLLLSLANSQSFPYVSFHGKTLANHGYVDLSLVGRPEDGGEGVQCHTACCSGREGPHRGDWYFPDGTTRLPFSNGGDDIYENRGAQRVDLHSRNNALSPIGIYRCTIDVHDDIDISVYLGLYTASGGMFYNNTAIYTQMHTFL